MGQLNVRHLLRRGFLGKSLVEEERVHLVPSLEPVHCDLFQLVVLVVKDGQDGPFSTDPLHFNVGVLVDFCRAILVPFEELSEFLVLVQGSRGTADHLALNGLCQVQRGGEQACRYPKEEEISHCIIVM